MPQSAAFFLVWITKILKILKTDYISAMLKQKFSTPVQGTRVQRSVQTKGGITLILEPKSVTVIVEPERKVKNDFREGVEL